MKNSKKILEAQLRDVGPEDAQLYLESRGWERTKTTPRGGIVFRNPRVREAEVFLPLDREYKDFTRRMGDLVVSLAEIEERPVNSLLNDLSGPMCDAVRIRVESPETRSGSVPLTQGLKLLTSGRDLLRSVADSLVAPENFFYPKSQKKSVQDFLAGCRMGQTQRGSFVATILTPPIPREVEEPMSLPFAEGDVTVSDPFARQVTNGLMTGLNGITTSILIGRQDDSIIGPPKGVSVNFCEALVDMEPPVDQSSLEISVDWSRSRPNPKQNSRASRFTMTKRDFPFLQEYVSGLRAKNTPKKARYQGRIVELSKRVRNLIEDEGGRVVIATKINGRNARIKVELSANDYVQACDAHRDRLRVSVSGVILQEETTSDYLLSDPRDFRVVDKPDAPLIERRD